MGDSPDPDTQDSTSALHDLLLEEAREAQKKKQKPKRGRSAAWARRGRMLKGLSVVVLAAALAGYLANQGVAHEELAQLREIDSRLPFAILFVLVLVPIVLSKMLWDYLLNRHRQ